jgi:hypothetical protein
LSPEAVVVVYAWVVVVVAEEFVLFPIFQSRPVVLCQWQ